MPLVTLKFDPLPIGQDTPPPGVPLSLPGTINPYQAGMTVTVTRYTFIGGQKANPQVVNSGIPPGGVPGQQWTFTSTVPGNLLQASTPYACEVTANVAHVPDNITFTTTAGS